MKRKKIIQTGRELREEMRAVARGERPAPSRLAPPPISAVLAPESVQVLKALATSGPVNVKELAALVGRAPSNLSRTLALLAGHGFVRMVREGRNVRPTLVAARLLIDFDPATGGFQAKPAVAA